MTTTPPVENHHERVTTAMGRVHEAHKRLHESHEERAAHEAAMREQRRADELAAIESAPAP